MKKVLLGLLVLACAVPAFSAINITLTNGVGADANLVTIGYACTAGEKVRAWAIDLAVTDKALNTGSILRQGLKRPAADDANYYVTPTNAGFTSLGSPSTLRVWSYGSPTVATDANGCTIEMASLYAANDPCVAHRFEPPASGTLISFRVQSDPNGNKIGCDGVVTVSITGVNAKRGGVVLENGTTASVNLPAPLAMTFYTGPPPWLSPAQAWGDATGDGNVNAFDLLALKKAYNTATGTHPHGTAQGQYNCACDYTHDGNVNAFDLLAMKKHYNATGMKACPSTPCP
jgi:hypothetical protein